MREWTISLNDYQRSNLLRMLNSFGAPYGNPWHNRELSQLVSVDTGDWFGEVAYLLGGVLQPGESVYGCRPPEPGFVVKNLQAEIKRLRAEVERLRAAGESLVDAVERQQWSTVDVAIAVWKEASRG